MSCAKIVLQVICYWHPIIPAGAFPVPHALVGFRPDHACPLLLAFLQLVLGLCVPSFFLYVTERYSREVFLASTEVSCGRAWSTFGQQCLAPPKLNG